MAGSLTAYDAVLKEVWTQDRLEEQLYQDAPLLDKVQKLSRYTVGQNALVPIHVSRNSGYTAEAGTGGALNTAGNQGLAQATYNYTHHHQQIAVHGSAIDATDGNANAVVEVLDTEVNGALTDLRRQLQRQLYGDGSSKIAQCRTSDSTDVDLNLVSGANAIERGWLFVGQVVDVGTTSDPVARINSGVISAIDDSLVAFTSTSAESGEGTTHFVFNENSRSGSTSYEMNGLESICSTSSTLGGLTTASQPTWKAANVDSTSQALTLSLALQQDQKIHQKTGKKADFILTGLKQRRKLYELLQQQVHFNSDSAIGAGKQDAPTWNGQQIITDPDCKNESLYFGQLKHLFLVAIDKPYWQNKITGGNILEWQQTYDAYGAKLTYRVQLATNRRNAFAHLSGLT